MKNITKLFFVAAFLTAGMASAQSGVGVGTTNPDASSALDVTSTTKGFLMPRMTTAQRTAIASPATGLQVYDTDTNSQWYYNGTVWVQGASKADGSKWTNDAANTRVALTNLSDGVTARPAGKEFVITDDGKVGIGSNSPSWDLQVTGSVDGDIAAIPAVAGGKPTFRAINYQGKATEMAMFSGVNTFFRYGIPYVNLSLLYGGGDNMMIEQTGATGSIYLSTNGAVRQTILNDGKVGIGTKTPSWDLQVSGAVDGDIAAIPAVVQGKPTIRAINFQGKQTQLTTLDGTFTSSIYGIPHANLSMIYSNGDNLLLRQDTATGKMYFSTNGAVRQTILEDGNVGIGTMTPTSKLQVSGDINANQLFLNSNGNNTITSSLVTSVENGFKINTYQGNTGANSLIGSLGSAYNDQKNALINFYRGSSGIGGEISFTVNNDSEAMRITKFANIGIGTTTPTVKLEVNGAIKVGDDSGTATPTAGMIRFNTTTSKFEGYDGSTWVNLN